MSSTIRLRVRLPDGTSHILPSIPRSFTHGALLNEITSVTGISTPIARIVVAGAPPQALDCSPSDPLDPSITDGASLFVVLAGALNSLAPGTTTAAEQRGRGRGRGRGRPRTSTTRTGVHTLASSVTSRRRKAAVTMDDPTFDPDWLEDDSEQDSSPKRARTSARPSASTRGRARGRGRGRGRGRRSDKGGRVLSTGEAEDAAIEHRWDALEKLSIELVKVAGKSEELLDIREKSLKKGLSKALKEREIEAKGERRHAAWLAGNYELREADMGRELMRVLRPKFRSPMEKNWEEEEVAVPVFERELLTAVISSIMEEDSAEQDRENLRAREMAKWSPRVFWNMVRIFPGDLEKGLKELVPDADWEFLKVRKRELSAKAKRNMELEDMRKRGEFDEE